MSDAAAAPGSDEVLMGPVDYLVIEFRGDRMTGEGWPILVDLVDRGVIRILDLAFLRKAEDGSVSGLALEDLGADGVELEVFEGARSGLLGDDDLAEAAAALEPGSAAGVLLYENTWAAPFAAAMRRSGGELVAFGRIPLDVLLDAVDGEDAS
ncbi:MULTISPECIES: DUF6325 family protein [Isoptericola]|nr:MULTISPECIES: DUF6325 family protein [unclassified Isoptericola]MDO8143333.1 DUF6325 family protein [Isoptericola sp. 178]MDO8147196.1 DUF6325 family protein [Isoptericola sp. b515]